ncbi:MAG: translation initiation factor IF-2 [candidate division Zixibacteria bacterium]|nr:translation initiation factor IF-2 [candidate division Zixibacteria bacterium]
MAKKRLYQVAKEYQVSSEAIVKLARELGFEIKSHMSTATEPMLEAIASKFSEEKATVKKEIDRRKKLQRDRDQREAEKKKKEREQAKPKETEVVEETKEVATAWAKLDEKAGKEKIVTKAKQLERNARQATELRKRKRDRRKKKRRRDIQSAEVKAAFKKTMAKIDLGKRVRKYKRKQRADGTIVEEESNIIQVTEFMPLAELAGIIGVKPAELIAKCMQLGMMVTINQRLDMDTISTLALEYELETEEVKEIGIEEDEEEELEDEDALKPRAPIVTIMGHVDHGKTSLLDHIRHTNVVAGESGAITQHIGAYQVSLAGGEITFLDTPGHKAFTAMRARGAQVTDIVVLVVAADDGVKPQTLEALDHARAAAVPIIVAVNKIDKPEANPDMVKQQLANHNLLAEDWGGKTIFVEVSAKTGQGVDKLQEMILLQAEILELKGNPEHSPRGVVVEAKLDRGRGVITTVIIQKGTLCIGEPIIAGSYHGKVRAMINDRGENVMQVRPGEPVQVIGMSGVPQAGDSFLGVESDSEAHTIAAQRQQIKREHDHRQMRRVSLTSIYDQIKDGMVRELKLVIKGDVDGSVQVLRDSLEKIGTEEVRVNVIHHGVGAINESDVLLASASDAIVIGFHVRPDTRARQLAVREKIDIRLYTVIYEVEDDLRRALEGLLEPDKEERIQGTAEVKDTFRVPKVGVIAGSSVKTGTIHMGEWARVLRDNVPVYTGKISSLKRFKDDAREVATGLECGIKVENFDDVHVGDIIETFEIIEVARKL